MKTKQLIFIFLLATITKLYAHSSTVATCYVSETSKRVYFDISIPLNNLSMIGERFNEKDIDNIATFLELQNLFSNNLIISLNEITSVLIFEGYSIDKTALKIRYYVNKKDDIKSLGIKSKNMAFIHHAHNSLDFWLHLHNKKRLFKIKHNKLTFKALY